MRTKFFVICFERDADFGSVHDTRVIKTHNLVEEMNFRLSARINHWHYWEIPEQEALWKIATREFENHIFG